MFLLGTVRPVGQQIEMREWFAARWRGWHILPAGFIFTAMLWLFTHVSGPLAERDGRLAAMGLAALGTMATLLIAYRLAERAGIGRKDLRG